MADRCFFVQGSKTLIDEVGLTNMAKSVFALFTAVDATTTTTTLLVDPNVTTRTILLPCQNTTEETTAPETTNAKNWLTFGYFTFRRFYTHGMSHSTY